ncbi:hypothetical protein QTP88_018607 [Uroleucon formosanum]
MPFESVDGYGTKVLGLQWHPEGDYLCCALSLDSAPVCTKRGILSLVARIFDPLGVFAPAVFLAKSIMQRTWQLGMTWDELLPKNIHDEWIAFVSDLPSLLNIRVPRYLNSSHGAPCYLPGFCDASQLGYAAVVYVRMADVDVNASVFLIGTKTKLAPIKSLTIPRLELNAALLLARWLSRVHDILAPQLNIVGINAWSDSTIVLSWLGAPHEAFKIYVSNRVHQIRTLLPDCGWRHVDSVNNPADCASRGIMPATLAQHKLYWHGPQLAYGDPSEWDDARSPLPLCDLPELRPVSCVARVDEIEVEWFNRFSSYDRMLRVVAYMRRFIAAGIRRVRRQPDHIAPAYLQKSELDSAVRILEAESQRVHFVVLLHELSTGKHVSSKPLARLAPFIDPDGVIRVGGRLRHSLLTYDYTVSLNQKILDILSNMQLEQVNIKKELVASNFILNRLLTKVEVLETNSKNNNLNSAMANQYIDSNFLSLFPINNKDAFLSVELKIVNEVDFVLKLESFIKSIGGRGSKNNITRVLQKLFSDEFAIISTWTGRGKNISIKIGSSEVIKLIKNSKKKDLSLISTKYFRRVLKAEQQKVNLNITSILNSNNVNFVKTNITNNDLPLKLSSVKDPMMPEYLLNTLHFETVQSKNLNLCVDTFNDPEITNHDPLLKSEGLDVPKDIRTLMKTPKLHNIVDISGGSYIHLGLRNMLLPILIKINAQIYIKSHVLEIGINIDGLPVSKSSKSQIWPILISILNFKELKENAIILMVDNILSMTVLKNMGFDMVDGIELLDTVCYDEYLLL